MKELGMLWNKGRGNIMQKSSESWVSKARVKSKLTVGHEKDLGAWGKETENEGWKQTTQAACACMRVCSLNHAQLFATPWTVAQQTPLSMGFSSQEFKKTGVRCHAFLQEIFSTQG